MRRLISVLGAPIGPTSVRSPARCARTTFRIARPASRVALSWPRTASSTRSRVGAGSASTSAVIERARGGRAKNIGVSRSSGSWARLRARSFMLV